MAWMIGIDEAGYGPNLGPLVVAASVWRVEKRSEVGGRGSRDEKAEGGRRKVEWGGGVLAPTAKSVAPAVDLYSRLSEVVSPVPDGERIAIADSKMLYKPGGGLQRLEHGVLTAFRLLRKPVARWSDVFSDSTRSLPWYENFDCALPIDAEPAKIADLAERFSVACAATDVHLTDVRARVVFPREFNDLTEHHGTKGAALSHISIGLLKNVLHSINTDLAVGANTPPLRSAFRLPPSAFVFPDLRPPTSDLFSITCDKHGGRNRYAALLQDHFPDDWIETIHESRAASRYSWGPPESRVEVCFRTKGEAELPTALASMTAKYHRELAMRAFNEFWAKQVPGIRPTAGYPQDARRFRTEIARKQRDLGIDDRDLWRNR